MTTTFATQHLWKHVGIEKNVDSGTFVAQIGGLDVEGLNPCCSNSLRRAVRF